MTRMLIVVLCLSMACDTNSNTPESRARMTAAVAFTRHYSAAGLDRWKIRGYAAGHDCGVLYVETSMLLEDSLIEALHYGTGPYAVYDGGGVQQFCRERSFRGAAYKDRSGRLWTFGDLTSVEAETLTRCR